MPIVWIPALLRSFTDQQESVQVAGATLADVIDSLDVKFPGIKARLCDGARLRPGLAVIVDSQVARGGLSEAVADNSEVHFIPAIGGGQGPGVRDRESEIIADDHPPEAMADL